MNIRTATAEDAVLLATLGAKTFSDTFSAQNTPENMAAYLAASFSPEIQARELADPAVVFLIAENAGRVVGYVKLQASQPPAAVRGPRPYELVRIYAINEAIGRGVGTALMQASLKEAASRGYETLWLGVWEHNLRALAFYRKWGFVEVGTHIFQMGDDPQTDFLMERPVAGEFTRKESHEPKTGVDE